MTKEIVSRKSSLWAAEQGLTLEVRCFKFERVYFFAVPNEPDETEYQMYDIYGIKGDVTGQRPATKAAAVLLGLADMPSRRDVERRMMHSVSLTEMVSMARHIEFLQTMPDLGINTFAEFKAAIEADGSTVEIGPFDEEWFNASSN